MSEILDKAKEVIMIMDWWLSPELYLRRPPAYFPEWRIDKVLLRKAQQGVRVYVLVYKEARTSNSNAFTPDTANSRVCRSRKRYPSLRVIRSIIWRTCTRI